MSDELTNAAQPSTEPQAGDPNVPATLPESTPSESAPEPQAPRGLNDSGLRFTEGDNIPSWAIGKTAAELLQTTQELYNVVQTQSYSPPASSPPSPSPAPSAPPLHQSQTMNAPDPNLIYSNPDEYHRQMLAYTDNRIQTAVGNAASSVVTPMASLAKSEASRNTKYAHAWTKYAPEIEAIMARVPETQRGNVDLWNEAASIVQGRHVDEIARTMADTIVRGGNDSGSLPTQGGVPTTPSPSSASPIERLFRENHEAVRGFKDDNISASKVIEHARTRGYTEEAYAKLLTDRVERKAAV